MEAQASDSAGQVDSRGKVMRLGDLSGRHAENDYGLHLEALAKGAGVDGHRQL
jgi:hypothetical protein